MSELNLVIGPDPIFRQKAVALLTVDDRARKNANRMLEILREEKGVGIGANMVGLLQRIIVLDLPGTETEMPLTMFNPEIVDQSEETHVFEEASLSFPGASAKIERPAKITVKYLDQSGDEVILQADGFLSTTIQHEIDYLDGRLYFDHLSRVKRDSLLRKYKKMRK
ncbi:peptide deformylase [Sneathiella sp. P13V-1]|uniref:peptide deformylase n=1 Tax=Sneathiella sp. P13V-1 TaxID=2697366 RepID=UPI00187B6519|nr:peptide deformylase [Sneathiella sp. P13V-1]MBE7635310.1 peptide deformylase [Sneathiella sp. P13V-1]